MAIRRTRDLVLSGEIADGAVTLSKLSDGVLSADAAGGAKLADGFVNNAKVAATPPLPGPSWAPA